MPLKEFKAKLIPELKELNLFIRKNLLSTSLAGEMASSLKGRGVEFEDYRDYTPEDDAQRIDWRASKRSQRILVREYKLEINFNVFFLIDTSESMLFTSTKKLKCEYAGEIIASLFWGILQTGNAVGFGIFNEKLTKMAKPTLGNKQFYTFTREISNPKNYGGKKNMTTAMKQVLSILDKKALVIIISDFVGFDDSWNEYFKIIAQKHELLGILVRDPRDMRIPHDAGQAVLGDPFSDEKIYIDAKTYSKIYEEYSRKELNILRSVFKSTKSSLFEFTTDQPYLNPLLSYFRKKGTRWR